MKSYARQASARWRGTSQHGRGAISTPSAALETDFHASDREANKGGTNSAELIAAAIAGSFSLTLADELGQAGCKPRQIDTLVTVTLERLGAGWTLTQILLAVTATVPNAVECDFVDATLRARANCPISRALSVNTLMNARLNRTK